MVKKPVQEKSKAPPKAPSSPAAGSSVSQTSQTSPSEQTNQSPEPSKPELTDEDLLYDFSTLDKINPSPSLLEEPAMIAPYHRLVQDKLEEIYKKSANKKSVVALNETLLQEIENVLIDAFTALLGEGIYSTYDEQGDGDKKSAVRAASIGSDATLPTLLTTLINRPQNLERGDKNIQKEIQRILLITTLTNVSFGSGQLHTNPLIFPPITSLAANNTLKLDLVPIQPLIHLWSAYSPTSYDIHRPVDPKEVIATRPVVPMPKVLPSKTAIKIINSTDYYLSQAILRHYPVVVSEDSTALSSKATDQRLINDIIHEIDPTCTSVPNFTPLSQAHINQSITKFVPRPDNAGIKNHILFYDSITQNYYNITNSLFTPSKTQFMYAMTIGAPVEVIHSMLLLGINVLQTDENGWTALRWALERIIYGRNHVFQAFGLMSYLHPSSFNQTTPVTPSPVRPGDNIGHQLAENIKNSQLKAKTYTSYDFQFEKKKIDKNITTPNPYFEQDFELFLQYVDCINKHIKATSQAAIQLYQSNQASTTNLIPDETELFISELMNPCAIPTTTTTTTTTHTKDSGKDKKEKKGDKKPEDVSKALYKYNGGCFDESLSEITDFMMVNAVTACYMIDNEEKASNAVARLGATFSSATWGAIQLRSEQWFKYPDLSQALKDSVSKRLQQDKSQIEELQKKVQEHKTERDTLQKQYSQHQDIEKNVSNELQAKQRELEQLNQTCSVTEATLLDLKKKLADSRKELTMLQQSVTTQPQVPPKNNLHKNNNKKAVPGKNDPPVIVHHNGTYQSTISPGFVEPFTINTAFKQQTRDLITTLNSKRDETDPLLDKFKPLPTNLDVSITNPQPYELFCTLYQHFVTDQPSRIIDHNDETFNRNHDALLVEHYTAQSSLYNSEVDFWRSILSNRAGLLHAAMIRMYQLEALVRKYKNKIYQLLDDIQNLEGNYAIIQQLPPNVQILSTAANPKGKNNQSSQLRFDATIPDNHALNLCIVCKSAPKEMITTCCFTLITCPSCASKVTTCPQCTTKGFESRQIKLH